MAASGETMTQAERPENYSCKDDMDCPFNTGKSCTSALQCGKCYKWAHQRCSSVEAKHIKLVNVRNLVFVCNKCLEMDSDFMNNATELMEKIKLELSMKTKENMAEMMKEIMANTKEMLYTLKKDVIDEISRQNSDIHTNLATAISNMQTQNNSTDVLDSIQVLSDVTDTHVKSVFKKIQDQNAFNSYMAEVTDKIQDKISNLANVTMQIHEQSAVNSHMAEVTDKIQDKIHNLANVTMQIHEQSAFNSHMAEVTDKIQDKIHNLANVTMQIHEQSAKMSDIVRQPAPPPTTGLSYAKVCMAKHESNTLIIKGKNNKTSEDIQKVLKTTLKNIKIDKMRTTHNGSVVLNLPDPTTSQQAKNALDACGDDDLETKNAQKMYPKIMVPHVALEDLHDSKSDEDKDDLAKCILRKNDCLSECNTDDIKIVTAKKSKSGNTQHVIIKCSPKARKAIYDHGDMIYTMYGRHQVYNHYHVMICHYCQGYDHYEVSCRVKENKERPRCGKCAGGHATDKCDSQVIKCHQCSIRKYTKTDHYVYKRDCPSYMEQVRRQAVNTEHGFQ